MSKSLNVIEPKPSARGPVGKKLRPVPLKPYAKIFRALGDETRMEMIALLAAADGELCVCEIEAHFDLAQPTISHHLRLLREAGIVTSERRGAWVHYALDRDTVERIERFSSLLRSRT